MSSNDSMKAAVQEVFDFWLTTCRASGRGLRPVLTDKRAKIIAQAITWYGVEGCFTAIAGCAKSEWHMGKNSMGKKYDSIELILRDAEHIERFAEIALEPTAQEAFLAEG